MLICRIGGRQNCFMCVAELDKSLLVTKYFFSSSFPCRLFQEKTAGWFRHLEQNWHKRHFSYEREGMCGRGRPGPAWRCPMCWDQLELRVQQKLTQTHTPPNCAARDGSSKQLFHQNESNLDYILHLKAERGGTWLLRHDSPARSQGQWHRRQQLVRGAQGGNRWSCEQSCHCRPHHRQFGCK